MKGFTPALINHIQCLEFNSGNIKFVSGKFKEFPEYSHKQSAQNTGQNNLSAPHISPTTVKEEEKNLNGDKSSQETTDEVHGLIKPTPAPVPEILKGQKVQDRDQYK